MRQGRLFKSLLVLGLTVVSMNQALACRYNVRETGFVDFGVEAYKLFCFVGGGTPANELSQLESLATEILADSSVVLEIVSIEETPDHPALEFWRPDEGQLAPAAALVSSSGSSFWLGPLWDGVFSPDAVRRVLRTVVSSPVRSRIAEELATAFGVVLLIEGTNQDQNSRAESHVFQALETLESELEYFPKPIKRGPVLITLTREELASERLLLWSFGLEVDNLEQAIAVVLYGRGRWIGPAMIGEEITLDLVSRILFIVGADCECDLDPRLLRGTGIPIPWDSRLQELVSGELGFDPNNPLVRMEVSQIMRVRSWQNPAMENRVQPLEIPALKDNSGELTSRLFSFQFLYLIGGIGVLVLCIGAVIWLRAKREKP